MKHEVRSILDGIESAVNRFDRGWPEPHTGAGTASPWTRPSRPRFSGAVPTSRSSS